MQQKTHFRSTLLITTTVLITTLFYTTIKADLVADWLISKRAIFSQIVEHPATHIKTHSAQPHNDQFDKCAQKILDNAFVPKNQISNDRAYQELQIANVLKHLNKTHTILGTQALQQLTLPVSDVSEIQRRQNIIRLFVENEKLYDQFHQQLELFRQAEADLLAYWHYELLSPQAKTFTVDHAVQNMYWNLWFNSYLPIINRLNKYLNTHEYTLGTGTFIERCKTVNALARGILAVSIPREIMKFSTRMTNKLDVSALLWKGPWQTIKGHLPWRRDFTLTDEQDYRAHATQYENLQQQLKGLNPNNKEEVQVLKFQMNQVLWRANQIHTKANEGTFSDRLRIALIGQFDDQSGIYLSENLGIGIKDCYWSSLRTDKDISLAHKAFFASSLAVFQLFEDYNLYSSSEEMFKQLGNHTYTMNRLYKRLRNVSQCIEAVQQLAYLSKNHNLPEGQQLTLEHSTNPHLKKLFELLDDSMFTGDPAFFYKNGRLLNAHHYCKKAKGALVPALQAIAELDALLSIATVIKLSSNQKHTWCFAEFVEHKQPVIALEQCWIPIAIGDEPVENDFVFGCNNTALKAIVAGPNGGGKSTALKTVGIATLLAHSWGIAPAHRAQLTPLSAIITRMHSQEDLLAGNSTFMAEKKDMITIRKTLATTSENQHILLLIDEPYRGTVDAEAAERIYQFGLELAAMPNITALIATHVEKPTTLAEATNGTFANYQVMIEEWPTKGGSSSFKRTYQFRPGLCSWWFTDAQRRAHFVDWLTPLERA